MFSGVYLKGSHVFLVSWLPVCVFAAFHKICTNEAIYCIYRTCTEDIKSLRLITAIKTPYLPDGRFDLEAYDALVNMQIENGVEGVIVGGTTAD